MGSNQSRMETASRITELEQKLAALQKENDTLRKHDKISKILRLQNGESEIQMSEEDVMRKWMVNTVRLPQYADLLISAGIELETVMDVTKNELEQLGITKIGHTKKILKYAAKLSRNHPPRTPNSAANSMSSQYSPTHTVNNIWGNDSVASFTNNNLWSNHPNANQ